MLDPYHMLVYLGVNPKASKPKREFSIRKPPGYGKAPERSRLDGRQ